eukprot:gnl/Trimastix_PCT/372.p1 GENE.gnl/Trimastix_PCT/372~~gnl/Trimastix_PCT/372.p1  ORF type:complete len:724 (+),score=281.41 gnl/Trimastix_PCT/372:60-2174(+)
MGCDSGSISATASHSFTRSVAFPNGSQREVAVGTTLHQMARDMGMNDALVAKLNGELVDLARPVEEGTHKVEFLTYADEEGRHVFCHSAAHLLGAAMQEYYQGAKIVVGPAVEQGYYYDAFLPEGKTVSSEDFPKIQKLMQKMVGKSSPFVRHVLTKEEALERFAENPFKVELIRNKIADGATCTAYQHGNFTDLCRGPHIPRTALIKAVMLTKNSSSQWSDGQVLQRIYGVAFPTKPQLEEYKRIQEEAKKRDHRAIGLAQDLWFFDDCSPGSAFFLQRGYHIYNTLCALMREQFRVRGFSEVCGPNIFKSSFFKISGHWQNYKEHMFTFLDLEEQERLVQHMSTLSLQQGEGGCACGCNQPACAPPQELPAGEGEATAAEEPEMMQWGLKPMNCPGHCMMFKHRSRSYRDLPIRYCEFGICHRNELTGALHGLTRVRRFTQDDGHIFCRPDQVGEELNSALDFMEHIYAVVGLQFELAFSTRPEKYMGDINLWDRAEEQLREVLRERPHIVHEGDGAFYGPKIDIYVKDALQRKTQCATIQLDFQLPARFDLQYVQPNADGGETLERPVMIHRAIFGSLERFIAIYCENCAGKWPFWLSPRQAMVVPVRAQHREYAQQVQQRLFTAGFEVDVDLSDRTLPKKVREAQINQYNFILVVGDQEAENNTVAVRVRDQKGNRAEVRPLDDLVRDFSEWARTRSNEH